MGAQVSGIMDKLTGEDDKKKEMQEVLTALQRQAEQDSEAFFTRIIHSNLENDKVVPISCILYKYTTLEIVIDSDQQALLRTGIQDTIKNITNSNISGAISGVLTTAIKGLLEKRGSELNTEENYTISIGKLGGVERFDYRMFMQTFTSSSYSTDMQSVVSVCVVVSSCDIDKLRTNDSSVLVQQCFGSENYNVQCAVRDLLFLAMDKETPPEKKAELELPLIKIVEKEYSGKALGGIDEATAKQQLENWKNDRINKLANGAQEKK